NSNILLKFKRLDASSSITSSFAKPCISKNDCLYFRCVAAKPGFAQLGAKEGGNTTLNLRSTK
ncbi:hypothetical protein OFN64_36845, partial [Escherichia coli]|nr:hypothetical protein [Escherichia coli]